MKAIRIFCVVLAFSVLSIDAAQAGCCRHRCRPFRSLCERIKNRCHGNSCSYSSGECVSNPGCPVAPVIIDQEPPPAPQAKAKKKTKSVDVSVEIIPAPQGH
jgi:hypothetical protein